MLWAVFARFGMGLPALFAIVCDHVAFVILGGCDNLFVVVRLVDFPDLLGQAKLHRFCPPTLGTKPSSRFEVAPGPGGAALETWRRHAMLGYARRVAGDCARLSTSPDTPGGGGAA